MQKKTPYTIIEKFLHSLSLPNDTTKKQSAQDARIAAQLKKFIDEIPGGFFIYRADNGKILYANKAVCHIFLCQTYEQFATLTGNTFQGMVYEEDRESVCESIDEQILQSQDDLDYVEYRIVRSDGAIRWVEDYGHFVRSEAIGDVFYVFIGDATDKINRRRALINDSREKQKLQSKIEEYDIERKLIQKEHLQRLEVIEGLSVNYDSILYCDLDSDTVLPYRLSPRLQTLFDKRWQERSYRRFIADYVKTWVHSEDRERVAHATTPENIRDVLQGAETFHLNFRCQAGDDTQYLQIRIVNVGNKRKPSQIVIGCRNVDIEMLQEIKQRQLLQESLRSAQAADAAKNAFLSNMSHDMRTPLNAILGFTALARKNINDPETLSGYLDKIDSAGRQILQLTEQVLELSYLESQDDCVEETPCDLKEVLTDVYRKLLPEAQKKRMVFSVDTFALRHNAVSGDSEKIKQIVYHLTSNAINYTPCGGTVVIKATEYAATEERVAYRFSVIDNGIGIAEEAQERIFEPFERENNSTLAGVFGTGLGLTIARRLAKSMGGDITVASAPKKGSTFTFSVSLHTIDAPAAVPAIADFSGVRILLVEDNELNLEIETEVLQDLGFVVDTAQNGKIALQKICDNPPDTYALVLMDIQMPVMDGCDAARAIRALKDERSRVPIVALSANALESDKRASAACGMQDHLAKPIDVPLLRSAIASVLSRS